MGQTFIAHLFFAFILPFAYRSFVYLSSLFLFSYCIVPYRFLLPLLAGVAANPHQQPNVYKVYQ